jgi:outer membrane protein assembly factor BamC
MRLWLIALTALALMGCSGFNDDEGFFVNKADDYLDARERQELIVPEDLDQNRVQDPFPIPPSPAQLNPEFYPGRPPQPSAIYANDSRDEVRIQRLGDRLWLAVPESPDTVWPKVKQFLGENGVDVARELGVEGRLDSQWLTIENEPYRDVIRLVLRDARDNAGVTAGRDRILLRVERGMRERTAEIHLRHQNDENELPDEFPTDFDALSSDIQAVEADMLNEIGAYIAAKVAEQTVSMVAQQIGSGAKSEVIRNTDGVPTLLLYLDQDRAWAAVGQALVRAEVDVTDQDRDVGKYYVKISDSFLAGEKKGFFKRLFSGGSGKGKTADNLQIALERSNPTTFSVFILDEKARHIDRELSQELLVMIREFAS